MSVIKELIRTENNGTISFGNYELAEKEMCIRDRQRSLLWASPYRERH